jgi:DNA repair protein RadA/Sms
MAKSTTIFSCSACDAQFQKWTGRCLECGAWGTIEGETTSAATQKKVAAKKSVLQTPMHALDQIDLSETPRIKTNIAELDRVLGGGLVRGSLILLGGEPGIGKSTLSIDLATRVPQCLYFSGEESIAQIKMRADRLGLRAPNVQLANETNCDALCARIESDSPALAIIDSIQTISTSLAQSEPGSPAQIRACTSLIMETAKKAGTAALIIGHVTKDGGVAGPKTLEHLVDTVLYLEGDRHHAHRMLRAVKNRFGATNEVGMFEMEGSGLKSISNPSAWLLEERMDQVSGSVLTCLMEGTRPILVEIQALVNKTAFGYPQRKASGIDLNRLHVLLAVLEKRAGIPLSQFDVHVNVVGGLRVQEPAADLAICQAIASAFFNAPLSSTTVAFGEVGLGGEVRRVRYTRDRLKECATLGMTHVYCPKEKGLIAKKLELIQVRNVQDVAKK